MNLIVSCLCVFSMRPVQFHESGMEESREVVLALILRGLTANEAIRWIGASRDTKNPVIFCGLADRSADTFLRALQSSNEAKRVWLVRYREGLRIIFRTDDSDDQTQVIYKRGRMEIDPDWIVDEFYKPIQSVDETGLEEIDKCS